jgi:hypothetical protein
MTGSDTGHWMGFIFLVVAFSFPFLFYWLAGRK